MGYYDDNCDNETKELEAWVYAFRDFLKTNDVPVSFAIDSTECIMTIHNTYSLHINHSEDYWRTGLSFTLNTNYGVVLLHVNMPIELCEQKQLPLFQMILAII